MTDSTADATGHEWIPESIEERISYLAAGHTLRSWLLTTDHKRIAILYFIGVTFFFFVGGAAAVLIRVDLLTPQADLLSNVTAAPVWSWKTKSSGTAAPGSRSMPAARNGSSAAADATEQSNTAKASSRRFIVCPARSALPPAHPASRA